MLVKKYQHLVMIVNKYESDYSAAILASISF